MYSFSCSFSIAVSVMIIISVHLIVRTCLRLWSPNAIWHIRIKNDHGQRLQQKKAWLLSQPEKNVKQKFIHLFIVPPNRKHCRTALERWMKLDPPLWVMDVTMSRHRLQQLDFTTYRDLSYEVVPYNSR